MGKFSDEYKKALEVEVKQFLFLSGERDRNLLLKRYNKKNLQENVRLASIAAVFQYKRLFLKISTTVQKDMDDFLKGLDTLKGNFALLESWITAFIENIEHPKAKQYAYEHWKECKKQLDIKNFCIQQLF